MLLVCSRIPQGEEYSARNPANAESCCRQWVLGTCNEHCKRSRWLGLKVVGVRSLVAIEDVHCLLLLLVRGCSHVRSVCICLWCFQSCRTAAHACSHSMPETKLLSLSARSPRLVEGEGGTNEEGECGGCNHVSTALLAIGTVFSRNSTRYSPIFLRQLDRDRHVCWRSVSWSCSCSRSLLLQTLWASGAQK